MIDAEDEREIRCPRLGHPVSFRYCRTQEGNRLCPRILTCWWEQFDVQGFLREHVGEEEFQALVTPAPAQSKLASILDIVERAKARRKDGVEEECKSRDQESTQDDDSA